MIVSNKRDNPVCDTLAINRSDVEEVDKVIYLGTAIDSKLNFKTDTDAVVKKAHKRLFIMKQLSATRVSQPIRIRCYPTFIECIFLNHLW